MKQLPQSSALKSFVHSLSPLCVYMCVFPSLSLYVFVKLQVFVLYVGPLWGTPLCMSVCIIMVLMGMWQSAFYLDCCISNTEPTSGICVCVRACMRACVRACVCVPLCGCGYVCGCQTGFPCHSWSRCFSLVIPTLAITKYFSAATAI